MDPPAGVAPEMPTDARNPGTVEFSFPPRHEDEIDPVPVCQGPLFRISPSTREPLSEETRLTRCSECLCARSVDPATPRSFQQTIRFVFQGTLLADAASSQSSSLSGFDLHSPELPPWY